MPSRRLKALHFGDLPIITINSSLQHIELLPGKVLLAGNAQIHASRRHPKDYSRCLPYIGSVISNPQYIGDDPKNHGKIELISTIRPISISILVAISIRTHKHGFYHVASFYPVSATKIANRLGKGFLQIAN